MPYQHFISSSTGIKAQTGKSGMRWLQKTRLVAFSQGSSKGVFGTPRGMLGWMTYGGRAKVFRTNFHHSRSAPHRRELLLIREEIWWKLLLDCMGRGVGNRRLMFGGKWFECMQCSWGTECGIVWIRLKGTRGTIEHACPTRLRSWFAWVELVMKGLKR